VTEALPEEPAIVDPPAEMSTEDYEFWDDATRTYYERRDGGTVSVRPYNDAENRQADAAANRAVLVERIKGMSLLLASDIAANNAITTLTCLTEEEARAQLDALTAQSNRQAEMLAAIARLGLGRFESLGIAII